MNEQVGPVREADGSSCDLPSDQQTPEPEAGDTTTLYRWTVKRSLRGDAMTDLTGVLKSRNAVGDVCG